MAENIGCGVMLHSIFCCMNVRSTHVLLTYAHQRSNVHSNNAAAGNLNVVYLFLFAIALLCSNMMLPSRDAMLCSHALIILAL